MNKYVEVILDLPIDEIIFKFEMLIRAYNPYISCYAY